MLRSEKALVKFELFIGSCLRRFEDRHVTISSGNSFDTIVHWK